jgi:hypothetical protein
MPIRIAAAQCVTLPLQQFFLLPAIQFALHLLTGNVSPFLIPKKEKIFAIGFSQSQRSTTL